MLALRLKSYLVGSPVGTIAQHVRWILRTPARIRHPELWELYLEEKWLPLVLRKLLSPGSNTVDVGCHVGSFLSLLVQLAPNGQHAAVEASPFKASLLKAKFPSVAIHAVAVGKEAGTVTFFEDNDRPGFSRIGTAIEGAKRFDVPMVTLDAILASAPKIDFIKIDIEGGELNAIKGANAIIARDRPTILFECGTGSDLDEVGVSRREIFDTITGLGYRIMTLGDFHFGKGAMEYDEFRRCGEYPFRAFNFLAIPTSA